MATSSTTNKQPIPKQAIEKLFQRLSLNYGKHFLEMWKGIPLDQVQAEWAQGLAGFNGQELTDGLNYALANCKFPPTLPEFRLICKEHKRAPIMQALPRKFTPEEMQQNRQRLKGIMDGLGNKLRMGSQ